MATSLRNIFVNLRLGTGQFIGDFQKVQKQLQKSFRQMERTGQTFVRNLTVPVAATGALALKASIDFETAFAGVQKTVDATAEQFQMLEKGIKDMSLRLPASTTEISAVAEAAGQLGIKTEDILDFTETMIKLGTATNLSSTEAATALARFANIMGTATSEIDNVGSTIVELGNNFATTEAEIVEMSLRLAGAGKQIGLTEADVLGFAAALTSVGIKAEAGGTAFSRVFKELSLAVDDGGKDLARFAEIAGTTSEKFAKDFSEKPSQAVTKFIEGFLRIKEEGGSALKALDSVGLSSIRVSDSLLRTANAGDLVGRAIESANQEFERNKALNEEVEKRYKTLASQLQLLKNAFSLIAIELGDSLRPKFQAVVDVIRKMIDGWKQLPKPVKDTAVEIGLLLAALGPLLIIIPKIGAAFLLLAANPIGALIVALGALAIAFGNFYNQEEFEAGLKVIQDAFLAIPKWAKETVDGIKRELVDRFNSIINTVGESVESIEQFFEDLYISVVGRSIVPDMVDGIGREFERLETEMVTSTQSAAEKVESEFEQMASGLQNQLDGISGNISVGLEGLLGNIGLGGSGSGGSGLTDILGSLITDEIGSFLGSQFGGRPEGQIGPLLEDGTFSEEASAQLGGVVSVLGTVAENIDKFGKNTQATIEAGFSTAGAGIGAFFGGEAGAKIGQQIGDVVGELVGGLFGSGPSHPETLARIEVLDRLNELLDQMGGIMIPTSNGFTLIDEFNASDIEDMFNAAGTFENFAQEVGINASNAFYAVGEAIVDMLGVTEDVGAQIGLIIGQNLAGDIDGLRQLVNGLGITVEQLEERMVEAGRTGEKSWLEVEVALQGIHESLGPGLKAVGAFENAFERLIKGTGRGAVALQQVKDIAIEAQEAGIDSLQGLESALIAGGKFTQQEIAALFHALQQRGITSLDQLLSASDRTLGGIIADIEAYGVKFGEAGEEIKEAARQLEKIPANTEKTLKFNIRTNIDSTTSDAMSAGVFNSGGVSVPRSIGVTGFAFGGVIKTPTFFRNGGDLSVAAEAGRPEAILPLTRVGRDLGVKADTSGAGKTTIIYNIDARGAMEGVSREIMDKLAQQVDPYNAPIGTRG